MDLGIQMDQDCVYLEAVTAPANNAAMANQRALISLLDCLRSRLCKDMFAFPFAVFLPHNRRMIQILGKIAGGTRRFVICSRGRNSKRRMSDPRQRSRRYTTA